MANRVALSVGCWTLRVPHCRQNYGRVAESGLRHSTRNRAWGNPPWVRIPPLPPKRASTALNRSSNLGGMKASHLLSFLCGAAAMIGFSTLTTSNAESARHVYELRLYHVNEGK